MIQFFYLVKSKYPEVGEGRLKGRKLEKMLKFKTELLSCWVMLFIDFFKAEIIDP